MLGFGFKGTDRATTVPLSLSTTLWVQVQAGVTLLRNGGVIAFPTDTLYGLGADFSSPSAVRRVIDTKGRAEHMGMPLLLSDAGQLLLVAREVSDTVWLLAKRFWPGALTMVVPRSPIVPDLVTGGRDSVAVRVPGHPVPRALASGLGRPIVGTSANRSGQSAACTAEDVRGQLDGAIDLVIDGGNVPQGIQSTIVDVTGLVLKVVRQGAVSLDAITSVYPGGVDGPTGIRHDERVES